MRRENAYLTVYMTLCLTVILSLCLTLIEGARKNGGAMEASCVADIGMWSVLAEYHRGLFDQYNLFAIDSSYGTREYGRHNTEAHLLKYLNKNLSMDEVFLSYYLYRDFLDLKVDGVEMTGMSILTDDGGAVFRRRAVEAIQDDVGIAMLEELQKWMEVISVNGLDTDETQNKKAELDRRIQEYEYVDEEGEPQKGLENPTKALEENRSKGILQWVVEDPGELSGNTLNLSSLISSRIEQGKVSQGNLCLPETTWVGEAAERFFFQEYLLRYMGRYGKEEDRDALHYQIEYLIAGKENDTENLRSVANRICALRETANVIYLMSDDEKQAEVELLSILLSSMLTIPEIAPVFRAAIVLGWAYAESVYDVKSLLSGGKIPLIKDKDSWHYGLAAALSGELWDSTVQGEGLDYEDYLRIFMAFTDLDKLTGRAMDMVEADIRMTDKNEGFCLDACYDRVEFDIRMSSGFGYKYQMIRQRAYD